MYSVSTNFSLELEEQSAREISNVWTLVEREEWGGVGEEEKVNMTKQSIMFSNCDLWK